MASVTFSQLAAEAHSRVHSRVSSPVNFGRARKAAIRTRLPRAGLGASSDIVAEVATEFSIDGGATWNELHAFGVTSGDVLDPTGSSATHSFVETHHDLPANTLLRTRIVTLGVGVESSADLTVTDL